ncbi:ABC transporter permease [Sedimentisphaera salicampi]|uniref:ABC-type uncharacterized transport system, permease component n=1 Tax=Sedimentisphaera salicampi TaxID=1941349 RepID=A0A1W6LNL3_9BACT|nr:ABC transporter permease [Sedimentisphaera salicampi]ARN57323.1 ABC-type uncharacterized transport system, permease component [Sedimentisphaera salicampi]OXU14636.1 ABC-type uncharacterized transport system, permease component [Sedimentisphaera salicampi]
MNGGAIEIGIWKLIFMYALLIPSLAIIVRYKLGLTKRVVIAILRMTGQLLLVGIFLKYIFLFNNFLLNTAWLMVMLLAANLSVTSNAGLRKKYFFLPVLAGIAISTITVASFLIVLVVRPEPFYDARYFIPLTGMILGNSMRGNVLVLERFYTKMEESRKLYSSYLLMGATRNEAMKPFMAEALRASLIPTVTVIATVGIVSLPGVMTGQILGGSMPMTAIKYQIAIMIAIFITMTFTGYLNLKLTTLTTFDKFDNLKPDVLKEPDK